MTTETIIDSELKDKRVSPINIAFKWALIGLLILIIQTLGNLFMNDGKYNPQAGGLWMMAFTIAVVFVIIFMAMKEFRDKELGGYISYGKAFNVGFITTLFMALFSVLFMWVFYNFIIDFDVMMSDMMTERMKGLKEKGMSDKEIQEAFKKAPAFLMSQSFYLIITVVSGLFLDTIVSLIAAAFVKKDLPHS